MDYGSSNPLASAIMQGMDPRYLPDILATAAGKNNAKAMTDMQFVFTVCKSK